RSRQDGGQRLLPIGRDRREGTALLPPVQIVRAGDPVLVPAPFRILFPERGEPVGLGEGERRQEQPVDRAEDDGGGSDAEGQRGRGGGGEGGSTRQRAEGLGEVSCEKGHGGLIRSAKRVQSFTIQPSRNRTIRLP